MDQQVRRELKELCLNILRSDEPEAIAEHLTSVQMLYEKLLVLNYLQEAKKKGEEPSLREDFLTDQDQPGQPSPREKTAEKPARKIETPSHPADSSPIDNEEETDEEAEDTTPLINESPVPEKELSDDKTPAEQGTDSALGPKEKSTAPRSASINDRFNKGAIKVGLNDRIAFVKHLFGGRQEDFNRVLSQVNTFDDFNEAEDFIQNMIKPDYNWDQKEEYEMRFMELIKGRFGME